jgi:SRSO17 transposase
MELIEEFANYLDHLTEGLGRLERKLGLKDYCRALMLPLRRKSIEPLAAAVDPCHVPARHQSLQHLVADSPWSDEDVLSRVQSWVLPKMLSEHQAWVFLIADDTGMPKAGTHSVGVARQYCGQLGKTDNCQVAVSLSIATAHASLPVKYRLYLPQSWTDHRSRCKEAGVPPEVTFLTKPQISLAQIRQAKAAGLPGDVVAADAAYGDDTAYRDSITELGLLYALGIKPGTTLWPAGTAALPPKPWSGRGKKPIRLRRDAQHQPLSAKQLAMSLPKSAYRKLTWREGTNTKLSSRFAAVRVRAAHRDYLGNLPRNEEWLLIEWPKGEPEPQKYFLSTLPANISLKQLVDAVKRRWRIERDYQELKQEFGLDNFEGRNWRGFHHHASLCIAAYGFLIGERLTHRQDTKKNTVFRAQPALPEGYSPRRANSTSAPRPRLNFDPVLVHRRRARSTSDGLPSPRKQNANMTQYD